MEINNIIKKINEINKKEIEKKKIKYNLNEIVEEKIEVENYLIKQYINKRTLNNYKNIVRLKSKRLENNKKYYEGTKKTFFTKLDNMNNNIFKKKWSTLSLNLKINRLNKYKKENNIDNEIIEKIRDMIENKQIKEEIEYNIEEGYIENIKINNPSP